jgi:DNA repair protein RadC
MNGGRIIEGKMGQHIDNPITTAGFFQSLLSECASEHGIALYLDDDGNVAGTSHNPGAAASVTFPIRKMVEGALQCAASQVILIHNHPSGKAEPSEADRHFTRQCGRVLSAIDIELLDHVIVAREGWVSFRQLGLL